LDSFGVIDLGCIDVALGIDGDGVDPVELACITATSSETADNRSVLAVDDPDFIVLAVSVQ
jgi:hypothetical protein